MKKLLALSSVLVAGASQAAVDTTAIETALIADIGTVGTYGMAILTASLGAWIGITLIKKFTSKAL